MIVNRELRDALAELMAEYLRTWAGRDQLTEKLHLLLGPDAEAEQLDALIEHYILDLDLFPERVSEEDWHSLRRHLAFLKTDRQYPDSDDCWQQGPTEPQSTLQARVHVVFLILAAGVSFVTGWWFFAAANAASFLLFHLVQTRSIKADDQEWTEKLNFHPFSDERDWKAHEPALLPLRLPAYDETIHSPPLTTAQKTLSVLFGAMLIQVMICMLLLGLFMAILFWPLTALMTALARRRPDTATTGDVPSSPAS